MEDDLLYRARLSLQLQALKDACDNSRLAVEALLEALDEDVAGDEDDRERRVFWAGWNAGGLVRGLETLITVVYGLLGETAPEMDGEDDLLLQNPRAALIDMRDQMTELGARCEEMFETYRARAISALGEGQLVSDRDLDSLLTGE